MGEIARLPAARRVPALFLGLALIVSGGRVAAEEEAEELPGNEDCATCHSSKDLKKKLPDGKEKSLFADEELLGRSVHAKLSCIDCHAGVRDLPHPKGQPIPAPSCGKCHPEALEKHAIGIHGKALSRGNQQAATCGDCHGSHGILSAKDPSSRTHHTRIVNTCGSCHGGLKMAVEVIGAAPQKPFFAYQESVHGKNAAGGSLKAAVCTDCHKSHDILPPTDSRSTIFSFNVPETCGRCHGEIQAHYRESIHGVASARGISRAPVCTDCHGIHTIKGHLDPSSSVSSRTIARTTCPQCHESQSMAKEFGLPGGKVKSYLESYHGLAGSRGSTLVANCASCHGIHDIYPSSDPRSTIHEARLAQTCGKCHPGVGENFTQGKIHGEAPDTVAAGLSAKVLDWTKQFYIALILAVVGGMLLHNFLDLRRKVDPRNRVLPMEHLHSERLDRNQRIQHAFLASSFILLVLTGFALRFPDSWLSDIFGNETLRRTLHRSAAVVMIALGAYHAAYLAIARKGRQALRDLIPGLKDVREAVETIRFNLGLREKRPEPARFGYVEKAEYWALVWGTMVMAATGLALWFKTAFTGWLGLPLWALDLACLIHYYEAWLAMLAIITWHFYFVIFDPAVYPLNWAWLHGRIQRPQRVPRRREAGRPVPPAAPRPVPALKEKEEAPASVSLTSTGSKAVREAQEAPLER